MAAPAQTHYELLGIDPGATQEEVQAAYRRWALRPAHAGRSRSWDRKEDAFSVLRDPVERARYDRKIVQDGVMIGSNIVALKRLAEGRLGYTYLARHIPTGKLVVVKHCTKLTPENLGRLRDEARKMFDLDHHQIAKVRDLIELEDGSLALVMGYKKGETLEELVSRLGRIHPESATWITERLMGALWYMHSRGVVHGGVEPHNIIIYEPTFDVSLVDFGMAQLASEDREQTRPDEYVETFASPEQTVGHPIAPESDIYSLGCVLLYMVTGGDLQMVENRDVPLSLPTELRELIAEMVAFKSHKRACSARKLFAKMTKLRKKLYNKEPGQTGGIRPA